jgi:hypothetical protein
VVTSLLPREVLVEGIASDLDDDDLDELIERIREHLLPKPVEPMPMLTDGKVIEAEKVEIDGANCASS